MPVLALDVLGVGVRVRCADAGTHAMLGAVYGAVRGRAEHAHVEYSVGSHGEPPTYFIERAGREPLTAANDGLFLALFDADLTVELQRLRSSLYFVHAAVLHCGPGAVMLVARSGGGKSTLAWALLHHGLGYLSDELGPVDPDTLRVQPYGRALLLKRTPPAYPVPPTALRTGRGVYLGAGDLPGALVSEPAPVAAIFFPEYRPEAPAPSVRRLGGAEGPARLYAQALNALAHPADGLDAAIRIATARPAFELVTGDLPRTCALVKATLEQLG